MTNQSKIIDRIRKLQALAQSDNVHEASAAAAQAQRLMTEHQIEEALLVASGEAELDPVIHEELVQISGTNNKWRTVVANALSGANGCRSYSELDRKGVNCMKIVGPSNSISTVRYMHAYLCNEVVRLAKDDTSTHGLLEKNAFKIGAAIAISERLKAEAKLIMAGAPGSALAVLDRSVEIRAKLPPLIKVKGPTVSSRSAFEAGQAAGRNVNLSSGLGLGSGSKGALNG